MQAAASFEFSKIVPLKCQMTDAFFKTCFQHSGKHPQSCLYIIDQILYYVKFH